MIEAILAVVIAIAPGDPVLLTDRVDVVEVNHVYDYQGRPTIDQLIFYRWSPAEERYQVVDWRLLKTPQQRPLRRFGAGGDGRFWSVFTDPKDDALRQIWALDVRETWTLEDPEMLERKVLPQRDRAKLRRGKNGQAARIQ